MFKNEYKVIIAKRLPILFLLIRSFMSSTEIKGSVYTPFLKKISQEKGTV